MNMGDELDNQNSRVLCLHNPHTLIYISRIHQFLLRVIGQVGVNLQLQHPSSNLYILPYCLSAENNSRIIGMLRKASKFLNLVFL